jgi:hypothetical protein
MDAVVTIYVDSTPEPVLTIPLQALLGSVDMGNKRRCFVMADGRPEMRDLTLGKANETAAEVQDGLKEGDVVILNPAVLLSDKEKAEYGVQATPSGPGGSEGSGGWKGKGKGKGRPGGGGSPGMPGGSPGMQDGPSMPGGRPNGGGRRGQGGAPPGGKAAASP